MKESEVKRIDGFTIKTEGKVSFIEFNHIASTGKFIHGFSCRKGGISPPPFESMNLGFTSPDNPENLKQNRKIFMKALGLENLELKQKIELVHGNLVIDASKFEDSVPEADGIITNRKNTALATTFADCVPLMIADPVKEAFAVIHAGWRGTFARIAQMGVKKMVQTFNSSPAGLLATVGPGIGPCCFEVGKEVTESFRSKFPQWEDLVKPLSNTDKHKIDLLSLNERIFLEAGIKKENVVIADLCTRCREDLFFSYRRDGKLSGRMAAVMALSY